MHFQISAFWCSYLINDREGIALYGCGGVWRCSTCESNPFLTTVCGEKESVKAEEHWNGRLNTFVTQRAFTCTQSGKSALTFDQLAFVRTKVHFVHDLLLAVPCYQRGG